MREALLALRAWLAEGHSAALATVVSAWGSAPRRPGAKMAVDAAGHMAGSVSGGCVEAAVAEGALQVLSSGTPRLLTFDVQDDTAWEVGLTCGGRLQVFVEPAGPSDPVLQALLQAFEQSEPIVRAVVVAGPQGVLGRSALLHADGTLTGELDPELTQAARSELPGLLHSGAAVSLEDRARDDGAVLFLDPALPPATLVIVGGVHIAMTLSRMAKLLGFRVVVVDPRGRFATPERFPDVDALLSVWPDEGLRQVGLAPTTSVAVLSHDPKLDDPALMIALRSPAGYVGALGSRRTHARRRTRLLEAGLTEAELGRLHAPIGLDLGGETPEEIALSILAQVVEARAAGGKGVPVQPAARAAPGPA